MLSSNVFTKKGYFYKFLRPWIGLGLVTSGGEMWRKQRKMIQPAFHFAVMNNIVGIVNRKAEVLLQILELQADSQWFDILPIMYACSLDIMVEAFMNVQLDVQHGNCLEYSESIRRITALVSERVTNVMLHRDFVHRFTDNYKKQQECYRVLHGLSSKLVQEKMKERREQEGTPEIEESNAKKKSLIEILVNLKDPVTGYLTEKQIRDEVDTFLFAGQDTTATAVCWSILLVGQHPDVQKKIFEELDEVFGDSDRFPEKEDLPKLKYLECVFKEALRLYPPIPFISRRIFQNSAVGDYFIPAGVNIAVHIHQLHRSSDHYENPNKFDPSHFFTENVQKRHPYAYLPFSAGPRNCIGQKFATIEAKIILAQIFRNYEIESKFKMEENVPILDLVFNSENGIVIRIKKRTPRA
ncbi:hypothetical protein V9T40_000495 [Parthenolecanium corni]|uniref:aromatase n=1 Tax=Parthenolecanium corni TaxID=536013 RepID=A0AAN9Y0F4_9HEMI